MHVTGVISEVRAVPVPNHRGQMGLGAVHGSALNIFFYPSHILDAFRSQTRAWCLEGRGKA